MYDALNNTELQGMVSTYVSGFSSGVLLHLFTNDIPVSADMSNFDPVEMSDSWYSPATIKFGEPYVDAQQNACAQAIDCQFISDSSATGQIAFGYWCSPISTSNVLFAQRLNPPVQFNGAGDSVFVPAGFAIPPVEAS